MSFNIFVSTRLKSAGGVFVHSVILKQTAATASDERVGVKKLEVKIKRDSQVTKSQAVFRRQVCFCSGHLIDFSLFHHICCVSRDSHNLTVSNYYLTCNYIEIIYKIIKLKWHGEAQLMLRELTLGPGGPTRPAAPGKPVAPWKINNKLDNRKGKKCKMTFVSSPTGGPWAPRAPLGPETPVGP